MFLVEQMFLILVSTSFISWWIVLSSSCLEALPSPKLTKMFWYSSILFSKSFIVLLFTFKYLIHLDLISHMVWNRSQISFLSICITNCSRIIYWIVYFEPLMCNAGTVINQISRHVWVCFWALVSSHVLICPCVHQHKPALVFHHLIIMLGILKAKSHHFSSLEMF